MDTLASLTKDQLIALVKEQAEALKAAPQAIAARKEEIAWLKSGGSGDKPQREIPAFVKAQTKPTAPKLRKKRAQNFTHHRLPPTEESVHACETCPQCHGPLRGGWERSRRQIIALPPISPRLTDHVTLSRYCARCGKTVTPRPDLSAHATGPQTFGHGVVSLCAYLKTVGRVPIAGICRLLSALMGLKVSAGQVTEMLHTVAGQGKATQDGLQKALRAAPFVHADETGWRENGQNGYVWSFSTPTLRYFRYRKSCAAAVAEEVLGADYGGILVSDFDAAQAFHFGLHQRCRAPLLRDLEELTRKSPTDSVRKWVEGVSALYWEARNFCSPDPKARALARVDFQARLPRHSLAYVAACLPQSVLAKRRVNFEAELFTFVEYPGVPSENNPAERSVRPVVIARKVSGGTRSAAGSETRAALASLFGTWQARGAESLAACRQMLIESQKPQPTAAV